LLQGNGEPAAVEAEGGEGEPVAANDHDDPRGGR
jgi:hypothetical protein